MTEWPDVMTSSPPRVGGHARRLHRSPLRKRQR
jgi:hypothetical protein